MNGINFDQLCLSITPSNAITVVSTAHAQAQYSQVILMYTADSEATVFPRSDAAATIFSFC